MNTPPLRLNLTAVSINRKPQRVSLLEVVPENTMKGWAASLYIFMNLAWDYVDTILNICALMKIRETKPLMRRVRDLKRRYDQFRSSAVDDECYRKETEMAEIFLEFVNPHMKRLFNGLDFEMSKMDLEGDWRTLAISVQQAMTFIDTAFLYAKHCMDKVNARGYYFKDDAMVQDEFKELARIVPQFAGDCYDPKSQTRKLTAGILLNEMLKLDIEPYWENRNEQG